MSRSMYAVGVRETYGLRYQLASDPGHVDLMTPWYEERAARQFLRHRSGSVVFTDLSGEAAGILPGSAHRTNLTRYVPFAPEYGPVSGDLTAHYESRSDKPWPMVNLWEQPGVRYPWDVEIHVGSDMPKGGE